VPAPAVIPAPIAYIKVVAVKKLVVGFWDVLSRGSVCLHVRCALSSTSFQRVLVLSALNWVGRYLPLVYFEKIRVFKAGGLRH
jgi:hypothetical protein